MYMNLLEIRLDNVYESFLKIRLDIVYESFENKA